MTETNNEYITRYEKLQLDRDAMRDKLKIAVEALEYAKKACLCERFPNRKMKRGFDYHEIHPKLGKCEAGARWFTPVDKIEAALASIKEGK
ncbi:hypothetical protein UFOVP1454_15 [uncultured Caudovirales phage]|uniref:Uncharacterized protein n=1 Tax=uncultured Caudovirales phage TaxID=2100421 RepID=A0A6J5SI34_9CAUD|nr:hypothetical protein UFOVP1454_15 [uncultured Caudovirales phage]